MSGTNKEYLKEIESKLTNLIRVVLNEAEVNHEFYLKLEEVIVSDSLKAIPKISKKQQAKAYFNVVAFLKEQGAEKLTAHLETQPNDDLREILRAEGIRKGKELKSIERQQMIEEIIQTAERRLNQGKSFLQ